MKRIHVVSLDEEEPLSEELIDKTRVLCYLVYEEIMCLEYDSDVKILCHDNIKYNELLERQEKMTYRHRFINNTPETVEYEPFMINNTTFAFTVNDGTISKEDILNIINKVRIYVHTKCGVNINSLVYEEDSKNKNRLIAIKKVLCNDYTNKEDKKKKVKVRSILPMIGLILR